MKDNWYKSIINADSKNIITQIPDNSVDFILTDPPYNLGQYSRGNISLHGRSDMNNDIAEWDKIDFNPEEWADEFIRILKPTGNIFIFTSYNHIGRWYNCLDRKFDTTNFMIWHKTNPAPKIFRAGFLNSCEMIFTCWNKKHTWNFISQKEMHNFLETPICMPPERLKDPKHPAQKPVSILKKMITIASNESDIVFDPFMGVGSTGVAALQLKRKFIGIEIDKIYFDAAKKRINQVLDNNNFEMKQNFATMKSNEYIVEEPIVGYQTAIDSFVSRCNIAQHKFDSDEDKKPYKSIKSIIKWAGGKEKELKYILPYLPKFNNFFEPFVGGGSVFMNIQAEKSYINDFSHELIALYNYIQTANKKFFYYAEMIDKSWENVSVFFQMNNELVNIYKDYREKNLSVEWLKNSIKSFCSCKQEEINNILPFEFFKLGGNILQEMPKNLFRKMSRMRVLEKEKHILPVEDVESNIETALKSAVYMNYRCLYNNKNIAKENPYMHSALFFFIRNYAYSGMFRYSAKGEFNVPYGGMGYNSKTMKSKLNYYLSSVVSNRFKGVEIFNKDFEAFLKETNPSENDFIFLDPPYDSEFSTYANNKFTHEDQIRLANYLIKECKAKWMMIIKNTDFIFSLYADKGLNIRTFNKEYLVSFMNRNNKKVTHLLITNY